MPFRVSIIIPAHNAAATLGDTLCSVCAQTSPHWEAIVIENGSTDATAEVAAEWIAREPRIRLMRSAPGVSVARNAGLAAASYAWILFLDADDWILPTHLERLTECLAGNGELDSAHCGWIRIGPDGAKLSEEYALAESDLFPKFARTCAFTIHSCITRRALLEAAGGFDPALRTCEDWDLWQRIARMGCRFGAVREALACYRARPGSASMNAAQLIADSRLVIDRGFSADPRVNAPRKEYAAGLAVGDRRETLLYTVTWAAGLAIGGGGEATPLLDLADTSPGVVLDPTGVAGCIFCCAMLPFALPTSAWADKFESIDPPLRRFLAELEARLHQSGLARSTYTHLCQMALHEATRPRPFTIGHTHAVRLEITEPIPDLLLPDTIERLHCLVFAEGERLGILELPVIDGAMPADVLADALAAEFAWPILGRFFSRQVYPAFRSAKNAEGWFVCRGEQLLGSAIAGNGTMSWAEAHDQIGWTVFLQEAWGTPGLGSDDFFSAAPDKTALDVAGEAVVVGDCFTVELSDPLPAAWRLPPKATAVLTVGGVAIAQVTLEGGSRAISTARVRAALTTEAAFELCNACVREGLLGRSFGDPRSLRVRLAERAAQHRADSPAVLAAAGGCERSRSCATEKFGDARRTLVLPRRDGACGTSASRRALLPRSLLAEIVGTARKPAGSPGVASSPEEQPAHVVYSPEIFVRRSQTPDREKGNEAPDEPFGRNFFEKTFREKADPWHYQTPYEQTKYAQTLAQLPRPHFGSALELACAEGHFTALLARRVDRLLATDLSATALRRAADRCLAHPHVKFAELDLLRDPFPGRFELIVCSEVLYYTLTLDNLRKVAAKIAGSLERGGYLVTAHAHLVVDEPHRAGFDWDLPFGAKKIADVLGRTPTLHLVKDLRTPLYRIQVYQRRHPLRRLFSRRPPERTLLPQPVELPPHAAAHALWQGGLPQRFRPSESATTSQLPILMYHHVAPTTPGDDRRRYRTTPEMFDAQLRRLAARGFRCVSLEEWRRAMEKRRPLPGRCVALTFDDGYRDFRQHAWPLLQQYGFSATVFLPSDYVGDTNRWETPLGEVSPLLNWSEIRQLRDEGVEFGSHSASHPALTSQSPTDVAREALRSRLAIEEELQSVVTAFAYPFGETDRVVEKIIGACGYTFGLTCEERRSDLHDRLLALPRLEIRGSLNLEDFDKLVST